MFFDTDVLIWALRGNQKAEEVLDQAPQILISAITYMELLQGVKKKSEIAIIDTTIEMLDIQIAQVNEVISQQAVSLVKSQWHSHSLQMADAMIAATAIQQDLPLITGNVKHFHPIDALTVIPFLP